MTRTGKIARLPRLVREELNRRLDDGETGRQLVAWLNSLAEVCAVLRGRFDGHPITEQNLSDWKQGGFQDWLRDQANRAWVRSLADQAEAFRDDTGRIPVADCLSATLAVALGQCLQRTLSASPADEAQLRKDILALGRGLASLRRSDHEQQRIRILRHRAAIYFSAGEAD